MKFEGRFVWFPGDPEREIITPNNVLDQGEESFLKMITRADVSEVSAGGNFYIGLCGAAFTEATVLATLSGEPSTTNGYARQPVTRDAAGWPTIGTINGLWRALTATINFTASGGDFSTAISRAFLTNVVSGTVGRLFSVGGALPAPLLVTNGLTVPVRYELYLR